MAQRCNAAIPPDPLGTAHIPGANAGSYETSTNDNMNIQSQNVDADHSITANDDREVNITHARPPQDVAGVSIDNQTVNHASTSDVVRPQGEDYCFQVDSRQAEVAKNTVAYSINLKAVTHNAPKFEHHADDGYHSTAANDDSEIDATDPRTSSGVAGFGSNNGAADQASKNEVTGHQLEGDDCGFQVESHRSEAAHNTTETLTEDIDLPSCNSCGFVGFYEEGGPLWEEHARHDVTCPTIQNDIDAQFIDISSRKLEICGENAEHLRLKEWHLCKACSLLQSTIMIIPCQHLCLCQVCAETKTCCPTCSCVIIHKIHVKLECEIPNAP